MNVVNYKLLFLFKFSCKSTHEKTIEWYVVHKMCYGDNVWIMDKTEIKQKPNRCTMLTNGSKCFHSLIEWQSFQPINSTNSNKVLRSNNRYNTNVSCSVSRTYSFLFSAVNRTQSRIFNMDWIEQFRWGFDSTNVRVWTGFFFNAYKLNTLYEWWAFCSLSWSYMLPHLWTFFFGHLIDMTR